MKAFIQRIGFACILTLLLAAPSMAADLENTLFLDTEYGRVVIQMFPKAAPKHVARIKELTRQGFYNGLKFHRVIDGFMAQTGDPTGTGRGGSELRDLPAEFNRLPFKRGTVGMARSQNPNSGNSQFFICFQAAPHLNGQYTVWGQVTHGMQYIDKIKKGYGRGGTVSDPDIIVRMQVAADVPQ